MTEFNALCNFIQSNKFKIVIVEGPRGVGKTTFCKNLLEASDMVLYKTWGGEQKLVRHEMRDKLNLDLPQGTYFILDFLRQVDLPRPILADRGNLSALAYQRELPYGTNSELHKYYAGLMKESRALMLVLTGPEDVILRRRIDRGEEDENKLYKLDLWKAMDLVVIDSEVYDQAVDKMIKAGLEETAIFDMGEGCTCWGYVAKGMTVQHPPEIIYEDS